MSEDFSITSDYWRKLIGADEKVEDGFLRRYNYPHKALRPMFWALLGILANTYWKIDFIGRENIPKSPPYIIAPSHASFLDYPSVGLGIGKKRDDIYVLAAKHYYDHFPARFFMKIAANVDRIDSVDDFFPALKAAARILKAGKSVCIMPEGTRSKTGELQPFRYGVGILAVELNVPIVPVHIKGAFECMPPGSIFPHPGRIQVSFGEPIHMDQYRPKLKDQNAYYIYKEVTDELFKRVEGLRDRLH